VYLVISQLQAAAEPGVLYEVYLAPSEEAMGKPSAKHRVGTMNFFDAVSHGEEAHVNDDNFVSFDVTSLIRRWHLEKGLKAEPSITIVPVGEPATDAKPIVGSIKIIAQ
jgi:tyrosinase